MRIDTPMDIAPDTGIGTAADTRMRRLTRKLPIGSKPIRGR